MLKAVMAEAEDRREPGGPPVEIWQKMERLFFYWPGAGHGSGYEVNTKT